MKDGAMELPGLSPASWLEANPQIRIVRVDSDAMQPTFMLGDLVLFDAFETTITRDDFYVLHHADTPAIRRLQVRPGAFAVIADNPLYQDYELPACKVDQLNVLGRVVAHLRRV